jgi:predicted O-methyltransferase YrrM
VRLDDILTGPWGMLPTERAVFAGILSALKPELAIELGTDRGDGTRWIAAHASHMHTFDFAPRMVDPPSNVTFHVGDIRTTLPKALHAFEAESRTVDFVFVDADHSTS